ncbi:MAG: hypothetical protein ACREQW_15360 [Candidatus Binatia bacterium]
MERARMKNLVIAAAFAVLMPALSACYYPDYDRHYGRDRDYRGRHDDSWRDRYGRYRYRDRDDYWDRHGRYRDRDDRYGSRDRDRDDD